MSDAGGHRVGGPGKSAHVGDPEHRMNRFDVAPLDARDDRTMKARIVEAKVADTRRIPRFIKELTRFEKQRLRTTGAAGARLQPGRNRRLSRRRSDVGLDL